MITVGYVRSRLGGTNMKHQVLCNLSEGMSKKWAGCKFSNFGLIKEENLPQITSNHAARKLIPSKRFPPLTQVSKTVWQSAAGKFVRDGEMQHNHRQNRPTVLGGGSTGGGINIEHGPDARTGRSHTVREVERCKAPKLDHFHGFVVSWCLICTSGTS